MSPLEERRLLEAVAGLQSQLAAAHAKLADFEGRRERTSDRAHELSRTLTDVEERMSDETRAVIRHVRQLEKQLAAVTQQLAAKGELETKKADRAKVLQAWAKLWVPLAVGLLGAVTGVVEEVLRATDVIRKIIQALG